MKQYPSIEGSPIKGATFYAFDKLDGSNIRAEWSPKKGFWKFGSRTQLIDETHFLGKHSIPLIKADEARYDKIFRSMKLEEATCFFEFYGDESFAGVHKEDDNFQIDLIDVSVFKRGMLPPSDFVKKFCGNVPTAMLLYVGNITDTFIRQVRERTLPGMTFEGVVCKGPPLKKNYPPYMFKLKSNEWIEKVKQQYTDVSKLKELL